MGGDRVLHSLINLTGKWIIADFCGQNRRRQVPFAFEANFQNSLLRLE